MNAKCGSSLVLVQTHRGFHVALFRVSAAGKRAWFNGHSVTAEDFRVAGLSYPIALHVADPSCQSPIIGLLHFRCLIESTRPAKYPASLNVLRTEYVPLASNHYCANGACDNKYNTNRRHDDSNRVDADSNIRKTHNTLYADCSHGRNTLVLRKL